MELQQRHFKVRPNPRVVKDERGCVATLNLYLRVRLSVGAFEVLRRHVVEELAEPLDLVLLLGGHGEAGLVEHVLRAEDRGAGVRCSLEACAKSM